VSSTHGCTGHNLASKRPGGAVQTGVHGTVWRPRGEGKHYRRMYRAQCGVQEGLYRLYGVQFGSSGHNLAVQVGLGSKVKPHRAQFWPPRCLDEQHGRMYMAKFGVQEARESSTDGCAGSSLASKRPG